MDGWLFMCLVGILRPCACYLVSCLTAPLSCSATLTPQACELRGTFEQHLGISSGRCRISGVNMSTLRDCAASGQMVSIYRTRQLSFESWLDDICGSSKRGSHWTGDFVVLLKRLSRDSLRPTDRSLGLG